MEVHVATLYNLTPMLQLRHLKKHEEFKTAWHTPNTTRLRSIAMFEVVWEIRHFVTEVLKNSTDDEIREFTTDQWREKIAKIPWEHWDVVSLDEVSLKIYVAIHHSLPSDEWRTMEGPGQMPAGRSLGGR